MAAIPDDKVNEVRDRASIHDVVAEYVNLKKAGANYSGLCPFHGEKTPSFNVNPARGIFHCFGCGVGGDVFAFIMRIEGIAFPEAVRLLAKRTGVVIEDRPLSEVEKKVVDEREQLFSALEAAASYYSKVLLERESGAPGRTYLEQRGAFAAVKGGYRMGFAGDTWDGLVRHFEQQKIPLAVAEKTGLIRKRTGSGGYYDLFRNRLLFYITDYRGRVIALGGRVLDTSLPKYINSPESPIYHKSEALFGIDSARLAMRETGSAIIVEGYFDHLSLHDAGIKNVVATCGTALTPGHLKLIRRYADRIYTLFDADSAGRKATFRALDLFLEEGVPAYVVEMPGGEDPDTFIRKEGVDRFRDRLGKAKPIFQCYIRDVVSSLALGTVEGKVRGIEDLAPKLAKLNNAVEKETYLQEVARILDVEPAVLRKRIGTAAPVAPADIAPVKKQSRMGQDAEEMLLMLMIRFPQVVGRVRQAGAPSLFGPRLLPLVEMILKAEGESVALPALLEKVAAPEERARLSAIFVNDAHLEDIEVEKALEQCMQAREREELKEVRLLKQELARLDSDSDRYWDVLRKLDSLRNRKSRLL